MEFVNPRGLAALLLALPLAALWFRRRRRVRRTVPALQLWRAVAPTLPPQTGFRRLVTERALWLHLAALALLALALAAPTFRVAAAPAQRLALVVDTTASMGARAGGRTRLDEARALATRALDALPRGSEALLVEAGCEAALRVPATREIALLRRGLEALRVRDCGGDLGRALGLGAERLRGGRSPRLVAFTDGVTRAATGYASSVRAELVRVGRPLANFGITAAELRVDEDGDAGASLFVALVATPAGGSREVLVRADLLRDHAFVPVAVRRARVGAGRSTLTLPIALARDERADLLRVSLGPAADALAVDDVAWAPVPRGARIAVRLVRAGDSPWLGRALRADPGVVLETLDPAAWRARAGEPFEGLTVFHGSVPAEPVPGAVLGFADDPAAARALGFALGPRIAGSPWTDVTDADPRVRFVGLADVHLGPARRIAVTGAERVLVRAREGPVVAAREVPGSTLTLASFDPDLGDWPLRPGFVLFVRAAVEHARARREALRVDARRAGAVVRLAASSPTVRLTHEGGERVEVPVHEGVAAWAATDRVGLWRVDRGRGEERLALSLFDEGESGLVENEITGTQGLHSQQGIAPRAPWSALGALVLGALGVLLGDLWRLARGRGR